MLAHAQQFKNTREFLIVGQSHDGRTRADRHDARVHPPGKHNVEFTTYTLVQMWFID